MTATSSFPTHWVWVTLGDVCTIERGVTFPSAAQVGQPSDKHVACLRTTNVQEQVKWDNLIYIPRSYVQGDNKFVHQNDILISIANSRELVGKVSFVDEVKLEAAFGGFISVLRASDLIDAYYLYSFLRANSTQERLRSVSNQTTNIANLTAKEIARLAIPLPPLPEQRRIANILHQADALSQWQREASTKIEDLQKALFLQIFGDPYENPKKWDVVSIDNLKIKNRPIIRTGPFGSSLKKNEHTQTGIPVWGIDNVKPNEFVERGSLFISATKFQQLGNYEVEDGDILISRAGTTGRMCVARPKQKPSIIGSNLLRLTLDQNSIVPEFFTAMFTFFGDRIGRTLRASGESDTYSFINPKDLMSLRILLPPIELQKEFLKRHNTISGIRTDLIESRAKLELLLQSLLASSFTGKLTASWREERREELQPFTVERDKKLGLSGEKPRLIDYEKGRITQEELEQMRQILGNFAVNVAQLQGEIIQPSILEINKTLANSIIELGKKIIDPFLESIRLDFPKITPIQFPIINREAILDYIDSLPVPQNNRAVLEALDTSTLRVLKLAGMYPAYFSPDDLETGEIGEITTLQAEASLRVLEALGFVKLVQIDNRMRYRLIDETNYTDQPADLNP